MCDLDQPQYLTLYFQEDPDAIPLDIWLCNNVPRGYRVITIFRRLIDGFYHYEIVMQLQ